MKETITGSNEKFHLWVVFTRFYLCDQIEPDETHVTCTGKTERRGTVGRLREGVDESISKGMTCEGVGWIHLPD